MVRLNFLNLFPKKVLILIRKSIFGLVPKKFTVNFFQNCRLSIKSLSLKSLHYCKGVWRFRVEKKQLREKVLFFSTRIYTSSVRLVCLRRTALYRVSKFFGKGGLLGTTFENGLYLITSHCFHISERKIIFGDSRVLKASYFSRYSRSAKISEASRFARGYWVTKFSQAFLVLG